MGARTARKATVAIATILAAIFDPNSTIRNAAPSGMAINSIGLTI